MNKYAFDFDDDEDDTYPPQRNKAQAGVSAKGDKSRAPKPGTSSKAPPVAIGYSSIGENNEGFEDLLSKDSASVKKAFADKDLVSLEENLGNNFYSSPWVPPDVDKASLYKISSIYNEGRAPVAKVSLTDDLELGNGFNLYFQYALSIGIGFFFIFILAIPSLVFAYSGQGVSPQDQDIIGLYQFTIANIGYDPNTLTYLADSACSGEPGIVPTVNQTCITVNGEEYTTQSISLVITGCEILQIGIFFIMIAHLRRRFTKINKIHEDSGVPSITDYAVHVTNIPPDTTMQEIITHFSDLYQLETVDFRGRLPVEDAAPVDSIGYSSNEIHVGTWIAECTMCMRMGRVVSYLERRRELMKQLYDARARMKMYGPKTPHVKGYQADKYVKYEKIMLRVAARVDKLNEKIQLSKKPAAPEAEEDAEGGSRPSSARPRSASRPGSASRSSKKGRPGSREARTVSAAGDAVGGELPEKGKEIDKDKGKEKKATLGFEADDNDDASAKSGLSKSKSFRARMTAMVTDEPVLAAFVCFEYNESFARCLEDYKYYSNFPMRLCFPQKMLFKGRVLSVHRAPEPDQIIWENIEVGPIQKTLARLRTLGEVLGVMILVYALFAAAADARSKYMTLTPPTGFCARALPQLFAGGAYGNDSLLAQMELTRAPNNDRVALDALCSAVLPNSYYALFTYDGKLNHSVGAYEISACNITNPTIGWCPSNAQDPLCPCRTSNAHEQCASLGCNITTADANVPCMAFSSADPLNCYCSGYVDNMLANGGIPNMLSWFGSYYQSSTPDVTDECVDTKYYFGASKIAVYLAIIVTFISNKILRYIVLRNVKFEHHISFDELNRAIALKVFLVTYLNMSIIILFAFGTSSQAPAVLTDNYLFSGPYEDFDRGWYGTVGFYLVVNFIIITLPQLWMKYFRYFVSSRVTQFNAYKEVT